MCAAYLGMTPSQVDECSLRDINVMLAGVKERIEQQEDLKWQRTLTVVQQLENLMLFRAGKRQKPLDAMYRQLKKQETPIMRIAEYQQLRQRAKAILEDGYGSES
jgi:hypothetical protein